MNKENFLKAIDTLKQYRRAELLDEQGKRLISTLYVDPLPDNHVLHTLLRPNTTFLIGRKGTGKSTIFQRAQEDLNSQTHSTWAYIDIKTLYEASTSEVVGNIPPSIQNALSPEAITRLSVFKNFLIELIKEIKAQISARVSSSVWAQTKEVFTGTVSDLFEKLDEFIYELDNYQYIDVTGHIYSSIDDESKTKDGSKISSKAEAELGIASTLSGGIFASLMNEAEQKRSSNYSAVFIRAFNIRGLITRLREILQVLKLKHLYIFIDDFSELPQPDMEQVVDTILAPLNNWSNEFIKLKIAVYPGRLYSGDIDISKVDEVYLDIYRAYGRNDVSQMEDRAIDFTKRLVEKRISHFCKEPVNTYFESENEDFWRTLFYACIGNPRILGYILFFAHESTIIYNRRIGIRTVQDASRRYYEEKISSYFRLNKFLHESFEERSSIYSLKELLEELVKRSKTLRSYRESKVMQEISGRPPTSHFHLKSSYESVLSTLELNFFLTRYYEMKDRDGEDVIVYALNFGLCQEEAITFGRPKGKREYRLYFVERIFDFTPIVISYIRVNQEIVCDHCGHRHGHDMLIAIRAFDMLCPNCKTGTCRVINLSRKYEQLIVSVSEDTLLPGTELGILKTLHDERREMFAKEIAAELDCSYQLIGRRGRNLAERGLVTRDENDKGRRIFAISGAAEDTYFAHHPDDAMHYDEPGEPT